MSVLIDIVGLRFGRLTVVALAGHSASGRVTWRCVCDCGAEKVAEGIRLRSGDTKSCGCLRDEARRANGRSNRTHGFSKSHVYQVWAGMIARCTNPSSSSYASYGGRGILVCDRWRSFPAFLEDMGLPGDNLSLDRIDNAKGYEPGNCRWATDKEQAVNRRSTCFVSAWGETKSLKDWSEDRRCAVCYATLHCRIKAGVGPEEAISASAAPRWRNNMNRSAA